MKKLLAVIVVLVFSVSFAFSQEMDTKGLDVGLRGGSPLGVAARLPMGEKNMLEAIVGLPSGPWSWFSITGLYEFHNPLKIGEIEGLTWYWGFGAHIHLAALNLGIDGVIGLEYDFEPLLNFPLSLSSDWKPAINILGAAFTNFGEGSITVRYHF